jgi:hypothetical protein
MRPEGTPKATTRARSRARVVVREFQSHGRVGAAPTAAAPRHFRFLKKSELIWMYCFHSAGRSSCG